MKFLKLLKFWFINTRYHSLAQSFLPALLAASLAFGHENFSLVLAFLAVVGVELVHMGMNLFDDYFDYRIQNTGYRDAMVHEGMRARIAKCPYLTSGKTTLKTLLAVSMGCCLLALAAGIPIFLERGEPIFWLTLGMGVLGLAYSGWPLRLSYRGLGELEIGLVFGPLLMSGVYYSSCGEFEPSFLLIAVPVGLLVMNIVYAHAMMDLEPDKKVGKMTLAVLAGSSNARLIILALVLTLPYVLVGVGVLSQTISGTYLLVLLTFPLAVALYKLMLQFVREPQKPVCRRFWMGPMSRWEVVKANGIEWFMVRWYLARNLLLFFCLAIIAAEVIRDLTGIKPIP
ncbi:MAG: prenyltransferase [Deltaproteobacteria bacterium]|jgi:1,4-dihydroxy-2-naphthoate octaprenyltransferase|nr:prenyltransferase [Deltaproteobacteria bacterium]